MNIDQIIQKRAQKVLSLINVTIPPGEYYLAGSCMIPASRISGIPCIVFFNNDIDLFFADKIDNFYDQTWFGRGTIYKILSQTKNATTVSNQDGPPIQFCRYYYESLDYLVHSFDFSHVQVGAKVNFGKVEPNQQKNIQEVCYTDEFVESCIGQSTIYTGSDYPLSSLIRASKYHERGLMNRGCLIKNVINILIDIRERGFRDYDDFKDQLDAVDLGLIPEDIEEIGTSNLKRLFELFTHKDQNRN